MTFGEFLGMSVAVLMLLLLAGLLLYALICIITPWFVALLYATRQYFPTNYQIYLTNREQSNVPTYARNYRPFVKFWALHEDYLEKWREYHILPHIFNYYHRHKHPEDYI